MASMLPLTAILNPSRESEEYLDARPPSTNAVNFYPYEDLDEVSIREIRKFQIHSFGRIQDSGRRIPYNTGKRDFYEKTGRTCFEVFQYDFKVPGCDTPWTVMWDYKIGLVRTTPFFKCCEYSKTISAKMLNQNPGLRDISHSITGGAIRAQGYWMPFECARAVCATFCYRISGALIPLFGPAFPSECIPPNTPHYGRMIINPAIIFQSKREADKFRRLYGTSLPTPSLSSASPQTSAGPLRITGPPGHRLPDHHRYWPSTGTDSDTEGSSLGRLQRLPPLQRQLPTPVLSSAESTNYSMTAAHSSPRIWSAVNIPPYMGRQESRREQLPALGRDYLQSSYRNNHYHYLANPYLSAVPSSLTNFYHQPLPLPAPRGASRSQPKSHPNPSSSSWATRYSHTAPSPGEKRRFDDYDYDAEESANGSSPEAPSPKVLREKTPVKLLHAQPNPSETKRCSLAAPVSQSVDTNHGSDTSKSQHLGSQTGLSESDPMYQSSPETRKRSPRSPQRDMSTWPPNACQKKKSPGLEDSKPNDIRKYERGISPPTNGDHVDQKFTEDDKTPDRSRKRVPSFSGAERVAALTLLHLGILDKQQADSSQRHRDATSREEIYHHQVSSDTAMDICSRESTGPSLMSKHDVPLSPRQQPTASIPRSEMEIDTDNSGSTPRPRFDRPTPTSSAITHNNGLRRGSRTRNSSKRMKGRSV